MPAEILGIVMFPVVGCEAHAPSATKRAIASKHRDRRAALPECVVNPILRSTQMGLPFGPSRATMLAHRRAFHRSVHGPIRKMGCLPATS
jgi:hypothetical protein